VPILHDLVIVMAVSLGAVFALRYLRVPAVVGFLLAGVLVGPSGLGAVSDRHSVEVLAEVGVVLLLFSIGLKFSVGELVAMRRLVFRGGASQLVVTAALVAVLLVSFAPRAEGWTFGLFVGALLALSSTAVVMRLLEEGGDVIAPHGRLMLGILIFQDIAAVPLLLVVPLLGAGGDATAAVLQLLKSLGLLIVIFFASRFALPWLFERVVRTRSREIFTLTTLLAALGTAWLCGEVGVPLSLGAFLAGIVISESAYSTQILSEIAPLKEALSSLFFVSVGMMVEPGLWTQDPLGSTGLIGAVVVLKALVVAAIALAMGFGARVAILAGLGLAQVGEFSFLLAGAGRAEGVLDAAAHAHFLTIAAVTMALTPFTMRLSRVLVSREQWMAWLVRYLGRAGRGRAAGGHGDAHAPAATDHVILVGYGVNGQNVARVLRGLGARYVVLELNPQSVRSLRAKGELALYADATQRDVLEHAGVAAARALVVAIADPAAARQIVALARSLNPRLTIIVRTRFVSEVEHLAGLGADEVVPEEFETSLELSARVLEAYGVAPGAILREIETIRAERYRALREEGLVAERGVSLQGLLAMADVDSVRLEPGWAAAGRSLEEVGLRRRSGATALALQRAGEGFANPAPAHRLEAGDVVVLYGRRVEIDRARVLLRTGEAPTDGGTS